jgi:hypothetical protein
METQFPHNGDSAPLRFFRCQSPPVFSGKEFPAVNRRFGSGALERIQNNYDSSPLCAVRISGRECVGSSTILVRPLTRLTLTEISATQGAERVTIGLDLQF